MIGLAALALTACRDSATEPSTAHSSPAPPPGAVNPDAGVTGYACADGQSIVAGYPDRVTAVVTYKGHAYTLKLAPSASGARYTGYGLQWWVKGGRAFIAALKAGEDTAGAPGVECKVDAPADEGVTRTSFKRGD